MNPPAPPGDVLYFQHAGLTLYLIPKQIMPEAALAASGVLLSFVGLHAFRITACKAMTECFTA